jgi:AmpD protein
VILPRGQLDASGWLATAKAIPSPNFNQRPPGTQVSLLVIHNISLPPGQFGTGAVADFFCNRLDIGAHPYYEEIAQLQVSAHFFISREGWISQFVSVFDRAWHAGVSQFQGVENCNDYSVGIELEGCDELPYTHAQYASLIGVTEELCRVFPLITRERICGHEHIAPGRKKDPGPAFDWPRYLSGLESRLNNA